MASVEEIVATARAVYADNLDKLVVENSKTLKFSNVKSQDGILAAWRAHGTSNNKTANVAVNAFVDDVIHLGDESAEDFKGDLATVVWCHFKRMNQNDIPAEFKKFYDAASVCVYTREAEYTIAAKKFEDGKNKLINEFHEYVQSMLIENGIDVDDDVY
jgi:hypothetical protein